MIKYLIGIIVLVQIANAHLCIYDPPQRGNALPFPMGPGYNDCYRPYPNCGNMTAGKPVVTFTSGQPYAVVFQQNYNHWYEPNQGYMDIAISYNGDNGPFKQLSQTIDDFNAWDMVTQTNFTINVNIPSQPCSSCVLRVRYISNNAGEPAPDFYQCADIAIE
ncbi:hypothetical protein DLAC_09396 [Tieghemostelium lacteum]|uniref:Chitin-binding type-4 domain-containing protein n=1 Tax=Tieghemostelium lacteum TaxID=361077 RepID=A0A151Z9Y0_TIELA|nr:hypothetical protein DLAC_09396 [Tieghemostelium lacteum]|eukprot:KYQ90758.1 hypothetical protein DLAC_09396 [Tieghemostelium lacteum]